MSSLKQQATKSVLWSAIERFSVQGIQYIINIIIARLLLPSDYGVIAMLNIFLAVFQAVIDGGFANALIQKKDTTNVDCSTVFYFNIAVSVVMYAILYLSSAHIALFFEVPQLDLITKVVGLTLIINSLGIVQQARLTIALDFKHQAVASLSAVVISSPVGVWLAYNGYGAWSLVWHTLFNNLIRVALLWVFAKWRPQRVFSKESFRTLFSFGSKLLASSVLHTIYVNMYTLIIGKKFAATELGFFNRATTLAQFPSTNFTNIIVKAIYPIQCKMQDDIEQLNRTFMIYMRMACYVIFPIMIMLCAVAEPMIRIILTDKWLPSVPLFQILCLAYMWDPIMKINNNILNVKGRSDYFLHAEIIKKIVAVVILLATIPFGVTVMCIGLIGYAVADMVIIIYYSNKVIHISVWRQMRELAPVTLLSFSMGAVSYLSLYLFDDPLLQLITGLATGGLYYLIMSHLFGFKEFKQLLSIVAKRKG